jgi:predicted dehydrogenase
VRQNRKPLATGEEGLKDIKLIKSILKAAETGKRIEII